MPLRHAVSPWALVVLCGVLSGWSAPAQAFKLNPCLRILTIHEDKLAQRPINRGNPCAIVPDQLQYAVHEHMTLASIARHRGVSPFQVDQAFEGERAAVNYMRLPTWRVGDGPWHETFALVFGTWWNDDPNMYLLGGGLDFGGNVWKFRRVFSDRVRRYYDSDLDDCDVRADQHIGRASHFGALQHLHFMTTLPSSRPPAERLQATLADAMTWIRFAYDVATGTIPADQPLTTSDEQRLRLPSLAANVCLRNKANAKVRTLFTRQGPQTAANLAYRNRITPDVALGSILHLLQDSFSPSHACRVALERDGSRVAALRSVANYNEDDPDDHAALDGYPAWLVEHVRTGAHHYANDPVAVGAWLLAAVDGRRPWTEVEAHLNATIFLQAPEGTPADQPCIR